MTTLIIATRNLHKVQEIQAVLGDQFSFQTLNDYPAAPAAIEDADSFEGNATIKAVQLAQWLGSRPQLLAARLPRFEPLPHAGPLPSHAPSGQAAPGSTGASVGPAFYCLADDSGLEVDALGGAPGVHSARFAAQDAGSAGNSSDQANNAKLLCLLESTPPDQRTARFRCVLALTPVLLSPPAGASPVCYADEAELQTRLFAGTCEGHILTEPRGSAGFGYDPLFVPNGFAETFAELASDLKNRISHRARALRKLQNGLAGRP